MGRSVEKLHVAESGAVTHVAALKSVLKRDRARATTQVEGLLKWEEEGGVDQTLCALLEVNQILGSARELGRTRRLLG